MAALLSTILRDARHQVVHIVSTIAISFSRRPRNYAHHLIDVEDQNSDSSHATIYAKFDGSDTIHQNVSPGCKLEASWPRTYGDIYYGADDCLYDSNGSEIQCCTQPTEDIVQNPYAM